MRPFFLALLFSLIGGALYAANENIEFAHRLQRLEKDIKTLNQYIYKEKDTLETKANAKHKEILEEGNFEDDLTGNLVVDLDIRISRLEKQLSFLYGKIENLDFFTNNLNKSFNILAEDIDTRFEEVEAKMNSYKGKKIEIKEPPITMPDDPNAKVLGVITQGEKDTLQTQPLNIDKEHISQKIYNAAFESLRKKDYQSAEKSFKKFLASSPEHRLAGSVTYWLGEILYVTGRTEEAMVYFGDAYRNYPQNTKKEESLFKLGLSLAKVGRKREACLAFDQLVHNLKSTPISIKEQGKKEMLKLNCAPKNNASPKI